MKITVTVAAPMANLKKKFHIDRQASGTIVKLFDIATLDGRRSCFFLTSERDSASVTTESASIPTESASIPAESGVSLFSDASEAVTRFTTFLC